MLIVIVLFGFAIFGIIGVFALKAREERTGAILAPGIRSLLDDRALQLKDLLAALQADLEKLPPEIVHLTRILVHKIALGSARLARFLEAQSHRLADLVSHKGRFVRRAPRSEFLNKVMEHKNGNGGGEQSE